jgi:Cu(I)/Ag(I) efflux system membrane fusion protein
MNSRILAAALLAALALTFACTKSDTRSAQHTQDATSTSAASVWYCPMHPSYRSDQPGLCPICNMTLVPLGDGLGANAFSSVAGRAAVSIPAERQQLIGVKSSAVSRSRMVRTIRAAGRVEIDERKLSTISLKYGGWIEELYVDSTGRAVKRGEPIFAVWSPELFEAEKSYLIARSLKSDPVSAEIARQRLLLWDMTEAQIAELEKKSDPDKRTTIVSRVDGVVTRKEAVVGTLAEPGKTLYEIADLSTVWVQAALSESDVALVKAGAEATIELSSQPGELVHGRIAYVYPLLDEATRSARARIEVDNAAGKLSPGMYATVRIAVDLGEQLSIDDDAIIDSGTRQIVFVDAGSGRFEPRAVAIGFRGDGRAIVKSGLAVGEQVVTSATFLVDSESRLKAAFAQHASSANTPSANAPPGNAPGGPMPTDHAHH